MISSISISPSISSSSFSSFSPCPVSVFSSRSTSEGGSTGPVLHTGSKTSPTFVHSWCSSYGLGCSTMGLFAFLYYNMLCSWLFACLAPVKIGRAGHEPNQPLTWWLACHHLPPSCVTSLNAQCQLMFLYMWHTNSLSSLLTSSGISLSSPRCRKIWQIRIWNSQSWRVTSCGALFNTDIEQQQQELLQQINDIKQKHQNFYYRGYFSHPYILHLIR